MGQRIYELEETVEDLRLREQELGVDLHGAEEAFESQKMHYENLVEALKEARKKLQAERDDVLADVKGIEAARVSDQENQRRVVADKDQVSTLFPKLLSGQAERIDAGPFACRATSRQGQGRSER